MQTKGYEIRPSKHFILGWMRRWNYDIPSLRNALERSLEVKQVGKDKYEVYFKSKNKSRKIICIKDDANKEIFIITGAEGK